jgi:hypothetical protein
LRALIGLVALLAASPARAEVIFVLDPPVELTRNLADWNTGEASSTRWHARLAGNRAEVRDGLIWIEDEGRLELQDAPHPNTYPFVRFRVGGPPQPDRSVRINASPFAEANERTRSLPLDTGGGESVCRLPPERILSRERYEGGRIRMEFPDNEGRLAIDYVMVDTVPTYALAEYDSAFPEPIKISGLGEDEQRVADGTLQVRFRPRVRIDLSDRLPGEGAYDVIDLRLRLVQADASKPQRVQLEWQAENQKPGQHEWALENDGEWHTYRLHLHKTPTWTAAAFMERLELVLLPDGAGPTARLEIDSLRLRDFPNPGGGNVSSGVEAMGDNPGDWPETARLIDRWRFVAGQSIGPGNAGRMGRALGRSFRENHIRWESDMASWLFCSEDRTFLPRDADGNYSPELAAQNGFLALNKAAESLARFNIEMDAVHFDGLFKRLLMPQGWPLTGRAKGGGFYEATGGDYAAAYEMVALAFCEFLALTRNHPDSLLKETCFYIQPNFHKWAWKHGVIDYERLFTTLPDSGNFREMMDAFEKMDRRYIEEGRYDAPSPLAGYGADWVFMNPQRRRMTSYAWYATEELGREFVVVNNGTLRGDTPAERARESLEYLLQFRAEGGRTTAYTPYYWQITWREAEGYGSDGHAILPETEPHTVTWAIHHSARLALFMEPDSLPPPPER